MADYPPLPSGCLDNLQAFDAAAERLYSSKRALELALAAGGLLRLQAAFELFPRRSTISWNPLFGGLSKFEMNIVSPEGTLLPDDFARIIYPFGQHAQGAGPQTPFALLEGPGANFNTCPWIRPPLEAMLSARPLIAEALSLIETYAPAPTRSSGPKSSTFRAEEANLSLLANFLGVDHVLAFRESFALDNSTNPGNESASPRRHNL